MSQFELEKTKIERNELNNSREQIETDCRVNVREAKKMRLQNTASWTEVACETIARFLSLLLTIPHAVKRYS